jgi:hypothetical protein
MVVISSPFNLNLIYHLIHWLVVMAVCLLILSVDHFSSSFLRLSYILQQHSIQHVSDALLEEALDSLFINAFCFLKDGFGDCLEVSARNQSVSKKKMGL